MAQTPIFTHSKCQSCVHSKHEPQSVLNTSPLLRLHQTICRMLKMYFISSITLYRRKTLKMMMIQPLLPPPPLLKPVKFRQIDHSWSCSSDKAPEYWKKKWVGELGFWYFSFLKMNCLPPFSLGTETVQGGETEVQGGGRDVKGSPASQHCAILWLLGIAG